MIEQFPNQEALYKRVSPALKSKIMELKKENIEVTRIELWKYLSNKKWKSANNLTLFDIVDDIFKLEKEEFVQQMNQNTEGE